MRFVEFNTLDFGKYDVIVLGFGPAGMAAASKASELGYRVLVLTAAESSTRKLQEWSKPDLSIRYNGIGGQSNVWGAQIAFPDTVDLREFAQSCQAAPNYVHEYLKESAELKCVLDLPESHDLPLEMKAKSDLKRFQIKYSTYLKSTNLLKSFDFKKGNVDISIGVNILSLNLVNSRMEINTNQGVLHLLPNQYSVICLGAIESTALLLRSELKKVNDLGHNLQDHPHGYLMEIESLGKLRIRRCAVLRGKTRRFKRKLEYRNSVGDRSAVVEIHMDLKHFGNKGTNLVQRSLNVVRDNATFFINALLLRLFNSAPLPFAHLRIWVQINQDRNPRNRIYIANGTINVDWGLDERDLHFIREIQLNLKDEFEKLGIRVKSLSTIPEIEGQFESAYHPSGTIPSNKNPACSIVNEYGILHSNSKIAVASTATWNRTGWHNPTFMLMVLTRMTVEKLLYPKERKGSD